MHGSILRVNNKAFFSNCPAPYPGDYTAAYNFPPLGLKDWTCPGGLPGKGVGGGMVTGRFEP